jgi:hypothetical protein
MAEETDQLEEFIGPNHDDMSVLNYLLQTIQGISAISSSPTDIVPPENTI